MLLVGLVECLGRTISSILGTGTVSLVEIFRFLRPLGRIGGLSWGCLFDFPFVFYIRFFTTGYFTTEYTDLIFNRTLIASQYADYADLH
jgi:hypothetical protein